MKINEIINEDEKFDQYDPHDLTKKNPNFEHAANADKVANLIETNCGQMLNAYRNSDEYLYRGIKHAMSPVIITNIRQDRIPGYLNPGLHNKTIEIFTKLGLKANRGNSIFCTTSKEIASAWGTYYIIFVKDGWSGTVFNKVKRSYVFNRIEGLNPKEKFDDYNTNFIKKLAPVVVTPENLRIVLDQRFEDVLITGQSYIALEPEAAITTKILKRLDIL